MIFFSHEDGAGIDGTTGNIMGDFNADLIKTGTHGPTSDFLGGFTSTL